MQEFRTTITGHQGYGSTGVNTTTVQNYDLGWEEPMVIPIKIGTLITTIKSHTIAVIDCVASTQFVDSELVRELGLPLTQNHYPERLIVVDGRETEVPLTNTCTLKLLVDQYLETIVLQVIKDAGWKIILRKTWLRRHNPTIDWSRNTISFSSGFSQTHCMSKRSNVTLSANIGLTKENQIAVVSQIVFWNLTKSSGTATYLLAAIPEIVDPSSLKDLVPDQYPDLLPLFTNKEADKLPHHRYVNHAIPLIQDKKPPMGRIYAISDSELTEVRKWIEETMSKGFIRNSSSSCASPILFVQKQDGSLRLCINYRALNDMTIKDQYQLPRIEETLNQIRGAKYSTQLDLQSAYNLIRIREGEEWKTAFHIEYGSYEVLVIHFGLTNTPASFQRYVNDTLREFLDIFCICYLYDILIHSKNLEEHNHKYEKFSKNFMMPDCMLNKKNANLTSLPQHS